MKTKILFLLLAVLPFLNGCNNNEDVKVLLVGKTWRFSSFYYTDGDKLILDRYQDADEILKNNPNGFTLNFSDNNTFSGKAINTSFTGTWTGDGKTNDFSMTIAKTSGSDETLQIAKDFINAIKDVGSYKADDNNLSLKYKGGDEYMSFYVKKN